MKKDGVTEPSLTLYIDIVNYAYSQAVNSKACCEIKHGTAVAY